MQLIRQEKGAHQHFATIQQGDNRTIHDWAEAKTLPKTEDEISFLVDVIDNKTGLAVESIEDILVQFAHSNHSIWWLKQAIF